MQNDKHEHYLVEGFLHVSTEVPLKSNQVMITQIQMPRFREGLVIEYLCIKNEDNIFCHLKNFKPLKINDKLLNLLDFFIKSMEIIYQGHNATMLAHICYLLQ